jgi:hypothetical protein
MLLPHLLIFVFSISSQGALLTSTPGTVELEGVKVAESVKAQIGTQIYNLGLVGAGLRYKKVAFFKAKVYVGEFFAVSPAKIVKSAEGALASLGAEKVVALRLTFVRDVGGEKVSGGFREALEENKVNLDAPSVKQFLDAVTSGGAVKYHQALTVVGEKVERGKEAISYESAAGRVFRIQGESGFVRDIFSIWLGKINDSGLQNFKDEILGLKK